MNKQFLEVSVNSSNQVCIIDSYNVADKGEDGQTRYTDAKNSIAKVKGCVHYVEIYIRDQRNNNTASIIRISPHSIKKIHEAILETEAFRGEEMVEE